MGGLSAFYPVFGAADKNAATYIWATGAFVFILGGVGLAVIELLRWLTRRMEAVRLARGEQGPGLVSAIHEGFEHPAFRPRMRIAWIVVAMFGLVAVIALVVNKTAF